MQDTFRYRDRIEKLRADAIDPLITTAPFSLAFWRAWRESTEGEEYARYADAFEAMLRSCPLSVDGGEAIVAKCAVPLTEEEEKEWSALLPIADARVARVGQDSHMAPDFDLLLTRGIVGILERIDEGERVHPESAAFYAACRRCLLATVKYAARYAARCREVAQTLEGEEREDLLLAAAALERVPLYPAETFFEAVQAAHFLVHVLSVDPFRYFSTLQFQLGRPDRYLLPYYNRDVEKGILTRERARFLVDCLAIQINRRVPHGLSSGYMVGGRDENGIPVCNDLTYLLMEAVDDVRLVYPSVGLCHTADMPPEALECACRILSHGRSHPAIFNDDVIARGLSLWGVPGNEARDYIHSTCVEITPIAASNVWVASPYTNMAGELLETLAEDFADFDSLLSAYLSRLSDVIVRNAEAQSRDRLLRAEKGMKPLLSCFVSDCLSRGLDIEAGGARYNWIMPSFVGVANAADSLYAVKRAVFEDGLLTLAQMREAISSDFAGMEPLRHLLSEKYAKYGNDDDGVDALFCRIADFLVEECRRHGVPFDSHLIPSVFCWVMHERLGRETPATPDGRVAGFPLGDGSGPCQGRERKGPTASVLSSTKWDHAPFIGGVAVNMKFSKKQFTSASLSNAVSLVRTFLERGGFEMQINVLDGEVLRRARQEPERYRDLVVRIGGYSDYYVTLSPQMQEEVLLRTEHEI